MGMQSSRGFTLIELMVTIAVIAILTMIAAPSMSNLIAKQQLNKSTRELAATLAQARSQAALLRRNVTVNLDSTNINTATTFNWKPSGKSIYNTSSITSIVFEPVGKIQNTSGTNPCLEICIKNADCSQARKITISLMGTASQSEGTC